LKLDIVGWYTTPDTATHGFLRSRGQHITIDFPGAMFTEINGISPRGDIIGDYAATVNGSGPHHGFVLDIDGNQVHRLHRDQLKRRHVGRWRDTNNVFHGFLLSGFRTACAAGN
jgi:hypothetical protein